MLVNCGALGGLTGGGLGDLADAAGGCPEFDSGDFSSIKLDAQLKGFLDASAKFSAVVKDMEVGLIASCGELGKVLDVKADDLKAEPKDGEGAKKVCGAVAAKLSAFMKANAEASLSIELTAPKCYADVDTMMKCLGDCGSPIQPGEIKASCQGGEISGECSGKCEGNCTVEAGAECKGSCNASCEGKCEANFSGQCGGNCKGKCDGKDSKAKCAGTCEGSCDADANGSCGGSCEGKCTGTCTAKASGSCSGSCSGGCDVDFKAPKCSGEFKPPKVSIACQAQCSAKAAASFKCDPPGVKIVAKGKASADVQKVIAGLQVALPKIAEISMGKAKAIGQAGAGLAAQLKGAVDGITKAGAKAAVCAGVAVEGVASAAAGIDVNVQASVSVSASASGSAGGKAGGGT